MAEPNQNLNNAYMSLFGVSESGIRFSDWIWLSKYRTPEQGCNYVVPIQKSESQDGKQFKTVFPSLSSPWLLVSREEKQGWEEVGRSKLRQLANGYSSKGSQGVKLSLQ